MSASGFPGNRVDAKRAGMTTVAAKVGLKAAKQVNFKLRGDSSGAGAIRQIREELSARNRGVIVIDPSVHQRLFATGMSLQGITRHVDAGSDVAGRIAAAVDDIKQELEERLDQLAAAPAPSGETAGWAEEREEIRGRVARLVEHLEGLL